MLNEKQRNKLADLLMDLAKGLLLLAFTLSIWKKSEVVGFLQYTSGGILLSFLSLYILRKKEKK